MGGNAAILLMAESLVTARVPSEIQTDDAPHTPKATAVNWLALAGVSAF
jgi:hypothetical protein